LKRSCITSTVEDAFIGLSWNIKTKPDKKFVSKQVCSGTISLLLPIISVHDSKGLAVYFSATVRKRSVTLYDIMYKIYSFYNLQKITAQDVTYISIANPQLATELLHLNKADLAQLRFADLLGGKTRFSRLQYQNNGDADAFSVILV